jgi:hypothetical protein
MNVHQIDNCTFITNIYRAWSPPTWSHGRSSLGQQFRVAQKMCTKGGCSIQAFGHWKVDAQKDLDTLIYYSLYNMYVYIYIYIFINILYIMYIFLVFLEISDFMPYFRTCSKKCGQTPQSLRMMCRPESGWPNLEMAWLPRLPGMGTPGWWWKLFYLWGDYMGLSIYNSIYELYHQYWLSCNYIDYYRSSI